MYRSMVHIQSVTTEIRRGKQEETKKKQDKNIMCASATQGGHKKTDKYLFMVALCNRETIYIFILFLLLLLFFSSPNLSSRRLDTSAHGVVLV